MLNFAVFGRILFLNAVHPKCNFYNIYTRLTCNYSYN